MHVPQWCGEEGLLVVPHNLFHLHRARRLAKQHVGVHTVLVVSGCRDIEANAPHLYFDDRQRYVDHQGWHEHLARTVDDGCDGWISVGHKTRPTAEGGVVRQIPAPLHPDAIPIDNRIGYHRDALLVGGEVALDEEDARVGLVLRDAMTCAIEVAVAYTPRAVNSRRPIVHIPHLREVDGHSTRLSPLYRISNQPPLVAREV